MKTNSDYQAITYVEAGKSNPFARTTEDKPLKTRGFSLSSAKSLPMKPYTKPIIKRNKSGWYVEYYYTYNGVKERMRYSQGLNEPNIKKRERIAQELRKTVQIMLEEGFNPFELKKSYTLAEAINLTLDDIKREQRHNTFRDYKSVLGVFMDWCAINGIGHRLDEITTQHIRSFLVETQQKRNLQPRGIEKYGQFLKAFYNRLKYKGIVEANPVLYKIAKKPQAVKIPLTEEEKISVKNHLEDKHPRFLLFIEMMYYCGLRPKEILGLKYKDIQGNSIFVLGEVSKNKQQQLAPCPDYIKNRLLGNKDEYIFREPGTLNSMMSENPLNRNRVSELWKRHVKEDLGIDKNMYSIRHLSAVDHWKNNKDIYALMNFLRHSDISMTQRYMKSLIDFNMEINTNAGLKF